jgi:hypothetical protein
MWLRAVIGCVGRWIRVFGWRASAGGKPEAEVGMSGMDRPGDGPATTPDVPQRESAAIGVDREVILTEARDRRECALAYRATVDAVYAEANSTQVPWKLRRPESDPDALRRLTFSRRTRVEWFSAFCGKHNRGDQEALARPWERGTSDTHVSASLVQQARSTGSDCLAVVGSRETVHDLDGRVLDQQ